MAAFLQIGALLAMAAVAVVLVLGIISMADTHLHEIR